MKSVALQRMEAGDIPLPQVYERLWENTAYRKYAPGEEYIEPAIDALRPNMGASFIDFGCGTGRPAAELRKRGYGVVGIDFAENCLDEGIGDFPFLVADISKRIALKAQHGFCTDVMEHIPPDQVDDVLLTIADCVKQSVFFSIALDLDEFGPLLAQRPLHLTIKDAKWWREKLGQFWPLIKVISEDAKWVSLACFPDIGVPREGATIQAICNTPDEVIEQYVIQNAQRELPFVRVGVPIDRPVVIVGGGPSLTSTLPLIKAMRPDCDVIALNGAAIFLKAHGIEADWQLLIDARPDNVKFVREFPARGYLLSAQVHPSLFDYLADKNVRIFYPAFDPLGAIRAKLPRSTDEAPLIGGIVTSGLTALLVAYTAGYREIHLFGYDSSDAESGESHAYAQTRTIAERKRLTAHHLGKSYQCSFAMYKQAEEFDGIARMLTERGVELHVHGSGLLYDIAQELGRERDPSCAVYDLSKCPASFDFIGWLVNAEMERRKANAPGPLKVAFSPGPDDGFRCDLHPRVDRKRFLQYVMRPALELIGAVEDDAATKDGCWYPTYTLAPISEAAKAGESVPVLRSFGGAKWMVHVRSPIVITLREATHWPQRNSNIEAWMRLASELRGKGHQIIFVRDTEKADEPLGDFTIWPAASRDLNIRMALYEAAKCNLFSSNGPAILALFSDRPFLVFEFNDVPGYGPASDDWWRKNHGIERGSQFPWCRPDQKFIFGDDSYPALRAAWDEIEPLLS